jgi:hypothetical protein
VEDSPLVFESKSAKAHHRMIDGTVNCWRVLPDLATDMVAVKDRAQNRSAVLGKTPNESSEAGGHPGSTALCTVPY